MKILHFRRFAKSCPMLLPMHCKGGKRGGNLETSRRGDPAYTKWTSKEMGKCEGNPCNIELCSTQMKQQRPRLQNLQNDPKCFFFFFCATFRWLAFQPSHVVLQVASPKNWPTKHTAADCYIQRLLIEPGVSKSTRHPSLASRALALLGPPAAEQFWQQVHRSALAAMKNGPRFEQKWSVWLVGNSNC